MALKQHPKKYLWKEHTYNHTGSFILLELNKKVHFHITLLFCL